MIVLKFGGTSVRNAEWINRVLDIAHAELPRSPLLVSSAMAGVTDDLLSMASSAAQGRGEDALQLLESMRQRHIQTCSELLDRHESATHSALEQLISDVRHLIQGISLVRECTPRTQDAVVSFGERLSTLLIAAGGEARGIQVRLFDSREFVRTDDQFTNATCLLEPTYRLIREGITPHPHTLLIAQGFIGATADGVTSTLGRGGSDFSATIFGAALQAEEVQIWTDVDGILTADPRIVSIARQVEVLSYPEAAELAFFGAKVVHPFTIQPAVERGIPVTVRNTGRPEQAGTRIQAASEVHGVRALATRKGITVITIHSSRMLNAYGFLSRIFAVFERYRISVDLVATSEVSVSMTVDNAVNLGPAIGELENYGSVQVETHQAILSLVGRNLWRDPSFVTRVFTSLADVPLRMISLGSSDINLSLVMSESSVDTAMRTLHGEFFE
ncbi:MAG: lysine-sensitive aspartokinase 3 [Spirochaetaceae bacterium]|nr:MAG: lysine-sensitive aspartokinase 3 [Spirochaetaceae bacterium]